MEHGHGNHSANDWASTAYWYQTLPGPPLTVPPVVQRLPLRNGELGVVPVLPPLAVPPPPGGLTEEQRRMSAQHRERVQRQQQEWAAETAARWEVSREQSRNNAAAARDLRRAWLAAGDPAPD
jgi:hypothetical protein